MVRFDSQQREERSAGLSFGGTNNKISRVHVWKAINCNAPRVIQKRDVAQKGARQARVRLQLNGVTTSLQLAS